MAVIVFPFVCFAVDVITISYFLVKVQLELFVYREAAARSTVSRVHCQVDEGADRFSIEVSELFVELVEKFFDDLRSVVRFVRSFDVDAVSRAVLVSSFD
jgi:hypothetical protein